MVYIRNAVIIFLFCLAGQVSVNVFDLDVASLNKGRDVSVAHKLKKRQDALSLIKHVIHVASRSGTLCGLLLLD